MIAPGRGCFSYKAHYAGVLNKKEEGGCFFFCGKNMNPGATYRDI